MPETPAALRDWFTPVVLENQWIRLEPLSVSHVPELAEVADDPEIWKWLPVVAPKGAAEVRALVQGGIDDYRRGERIPFAVVRGDIAVGTTSYLDLCPENRSVEIGWTWYGASARRTATNTASKRLLLEHALRGLSGPSSRVQDRRQERPLEYGATSDWRDLRRDTPVSSRAA